MKVLVCNECHVEKYLEESMMKRLFPSIVLTSLSFMFIPSLAPAAMIDLNDFFFFPGDPVTVLPDGSSALLEEDPDLSVVLLSNDPGLGDPQVILGGPGQILSFDFDFVEPGTPSTNNDEFGAFILDSTGVSAGPAYEFFTTVTSSGTVSFDLSSLSTEPFLGLQFQLSSFPDDVDFDSTLTISNVEIVPVPGAVLLAGLGLATSAFGILRNKRKLQN
jgi:hypothetical protein